MKCSRGKFSRLSNIKIDTLRYYEECGLVSVPYNEVTKQYEYGDKEIFSLFMIKEMRSLGLSSEDIKYHFQNSRNGLDYQLDYIDQKIEYYTALRKQVATMNTILKRRDYDIHETTREKAYIFSFTKANTMKITKEEASNWIDAIPFAWSNIKFTCDLEHYTENYIPIELALGIKEPYAHTYIKNLEAPYISVTQECKALYFNVRTQYFDHIPLDQFTAALAYAKEHNYHFNGNFGGVFKNYEVDEFGNVLYIYGIIAEVF